MNNGGFNQIVLIGEITRDPQERGGAVKSAAFVLTTERVWRDKTTQLQQKSAQNHWVLAFGHLKDIVLEHAKQGQTVVVVGELQYFERNAEVKADFFKILKP